MSRFDSYAYENERPELFTDEGQRLFLQIRDRIAGLLDSAGAASMGRAISGSCGSSWQMYACVDRLVELGELEELIREPRDRYEFRVFVRPGRDHR